VNFSGFYGSLSYIIETGQKKGAEKGVQSSSSYGIRSYGTHSQIPWYGMASGLLPNALSPLQNTSHMEYPRYAMGLASILAGLPTLFHTRNSTVKGSKKGTKKGGCE
jgi:hypothetical protein